MVLRQIRPRRLARCIFCPNPASTKEHAWEDWAVARIQIGPTVIDGHIEGEEVLVFGQKAIRIKCLCEHCNGIWLKNIQEASLPFLSAMAQDISITLDNPQQGTLAVWALTRAMVWEFSTKDGRPVFYNDSERRALREHQQIPANTTIWLARYVGLTNLAVWASDYTKLPRDFEVKRARLTTLSYKHLVVQILTVRPNKPIRTGPVIDPKPVIHPKPGRWPQSTARIFPVSAFTIWPPALSIGGHQITRKDFLDRWNGHPPGELVALS